MLNVLPTSPPDSQANDYLPLHSNPSTTAFVDSSESSEEDSEGNFILIFCLINGKIKTRNSFIFVPFH